MSSPAADGSGIRHDRRPRAAVSTEPGRAAPLPGFCRDCRRDAAPAARRCAGCGSPRLLRHAEIDTLAIAHVDCDAFYATIEKRDDPSLVDKPVIVGGRQRGVVLTCCYVARTFGVRSAMPMFEAKRLCPHASIVRPDMEKYARVGREVRALMFKLTPLVEPVSIDEAFMDLSGTARLHGMSPAKALASFADEVEKSLRITVSIGLSGNKFLAKIASDLDKPRGFAVLGVGEAAAFLAPKPVTIIFGVGKMAQQRLARDGLRTIGDLQRAGETELKRRYGAEGVRLAHLAHGRDDRPVKAKREAKSISAETTFAEDIAEFRPLELRLWRLSEKVSARLKANDLAGATVTLKLKTADFRIRTRAQSFAHPTQLAARIFATGRDLLARETDGTKFRLIGIGVTSLTEADGADFADLIDRRTAEAEQAMDRLREKFGDDAVVKGLAFDRDEDDWEE
jgi:DNA polymerase-4